MGGFLDEMAASIFAGFQGKLHSGIIRRASPSGVGATLDDYGDIRDPAAADLPCEGFEDGYSDFIRGTAGIPDTDLKVNIFAASIPGYQPAKDDIVRLDRDSDAGPVSTWYQLRADATDPAHALWVCRAFVIPEPA